MGLILAVIFTVVGVVLLSFVRQLSKTSKYSDGVGGVEGKTTKAQYDKVHSQLSLVVVVGSAILIVVAKFVGGW